MSKQKEIEKAIQRLAGTYLKDIVSIVPCNVDTVYTDTNTCDCTPIGGDATTQIPQVQLSAENNNGLVVFPSVGSTVIVALSIRNTAFVILYSDIDSVNITIQNTDESYISYNIGKDAGQQFNDGSYKGLVKVIELTQKLNNLENLVNNLTSLYNAHVHPATLAVSGSSATGTTNPTTSIETQTLTPTQQSDIENNKVLHGK